MMRVPVTMRGFLCALGAALLLQGTVFAIYYDDLLFFRRPLPEIIQGPRETFVRHAEAALTRSRLTMRHLDTIAEGAGAFELRAIEVAALERRVTANPSDLGTQLRLADALRRAGRLDESERVYLDILAVTGTLHP